MPGNIYRKALAEMIVELWYSYSWRTMEKNNSKYSALRDIRAPAARNVFDYGIPKAMPKNI